ncbi:hypothetical protein BDP81DRAFT_70683 [Colletotrichum phormii]|uniref:Uncharacterized protein n=1 Tax=Colletotrichum phormii TaxID=359342 RepID=A0AAJ0EC88_9PEZI|nr:uncharacterized protein BDP81DRAFT_70683 [Colletotrichum phormii]KAK1633759.1 hypothetical protein BDP81DRAFT_70683 [Colletotrichum phormii]
MWCANLISRSCCNLQSCKLYIIIRTASSRVCSACPENRQTNPRGGKTKELPNHTSRSSYHGIPRLVHPWNQLCRHTFRVERVSLSLFFSHLPAYLLPATPTCDAGTPESVSHIARPRPSTSRFRGRPHQEKSESTCTSGGATLHIVRPEGGGSRVCGSDD